MKNLILISAAFLLFSFTARAQYINIPDPEFKDWLMGAYPGCFNASGMMDTTCSDIINEDYFQHGFGTVSNWEGFQYFRNLLSANFTGSYPNGLPAMPATLKYFSLDPTTYGSSTLPALPNGLLSLHCGGGITSLTTLPGSLTYLDLPMCSGLTSLPTLPAGLVYLNCNMDYMLQSLPVLPNSIVHLYLTGCLQLQSLPALPTSLRFLNVDNCQLTSLPSLPVPLDTLICRNNALTVLPPLPAQIHYLDASNNQLISLPVMAGTALKTLNIYRNSITSVPALPSTLETFNMGSNLVTALPALPAALSYFDCYNNQLTSLPALPAGLVTLMCRMNQLTSLPAIPASLQTLHYTNNHVSSFPALSPTLRELECSDNQIANIPSLPDSLRWFGCATNLLTTLPTLPHFLGSLICASNQLSSLPSLPASLISLSCEGNHITCLPVLPTPNWDLGTPSLSFDDQVGCLPNLPAGYMYITVYSATDLSNVQTVNSYPLCNPTNNVNHCASFPLMRGHVYYDNNTNGMHDASEPFRANVRIQSSDGSFTFTDNNGYYQIPTSDTGNYTLSVAAAPVYFATAPLQYNFHFSSFDTLVVNDFGFQATQTRDSLGISINPVNSAARPGFSYPYQIAYSNDGTTTLNANVVFNYDNTRLIYDSCSNASVINTGSSLTLSEPGFVPGMQKNFIGYFTVNPTAVIGDSLRSGAHIISASTAAHDSDVVAIRGSFDPNDKSATPKLTPSQIINGDYIYYTIRFQNTGTDTAFSIVVTDTLDSRLQPSTMQMIATSHPCITTVKGNRISFEFINIMLPDSNVNPLKSHGYISFRIKPVNTLVVNDIVPNKASIYFDYNSPVITNMATTTVVNPIVVPLKLLSFTVSRGVGQNANLYWQTNDEVNVKNYIIEMSTNGRTYTAVGFENAKGYQYNNYTKTIAIPSDAVLYFRLKMTDVDGRYTYSNIAILRNDKVNEVFSFLNNPVKDELSISLLDESLRNTNATIYNAQGIKVRTVLLQHDVENVNIKSLPAGTYYLVTEKGSGQFVVVK